MQMTGVVHIIAENQTEYNIFGLPFRTKDTVFQPSEKFIPFVSEVRSETDNISKTIKSASAIAIAISITMHISLELKLWQSQFSSSFSKISCFIELY